MVGQHEAHAPLVSRSSDHPSLFGLFAQNHQSADNLDWKTFCRDTLSLDDAFSGASLKLRLSTWQRLSQQIVKHHRVQVVPVSTFNSELLSVPLLNSKFEKSFKVAMALTVRALTIKGVSPANIAKTQALLQCQQLQQVKDRQVTALATKSLTSSKYHRLESLVPFRSASISSLSQRSQQVRDHHLATPPAPKLIRSLKPYGRDSIAPLRTSSLPSVAKRLV